MARDGECSRNETAINIGDCKTAELILARGAFVAASADVAHVDEAILDEEGLVDFGKMRPIVYDSARRTYRVVGEAIAGA